MIPTWTYVKGKDGIYVNLFIGSTINVEKVAGTDVQMLQKTDYPWSGKVAITVNPKQAKKFSVFVRVPDRKTSALYTSTPEVKGLKSLTVNGKSVPMKVENGYVAIARDWIAGDKIDFELPMEVQRIKADERIAADRGLVALRYGPLIYNVERADQADINQPINSKALTTEWRDNLLEGVTVIKGSWANGTPLVAIPHYARNNRLGQAGQRAESGGDASVNYAPGSTGSSTSNSPSGNFGGGGSGRGRFGESSSMVWIKEQ
jgi:DUF1680 family protein